MKTFTLFMVSTVICGIGMEMNPENHLLIGIGFISIIVIVVREMLLSSMDIINHNENE